MAIVIGKLLVYNNKTYKTILLGVTLEKSLIKRSGNKKNLAYCDLIKHNRYVLKAWKGWDTKDKPLSMNPCCKQDLTWRY